MTRAPSASTRCGCKTSLGAASPSASLTSLPDPARPAALPPGIDISVYRIIQEALTNSLKHGAAWATVELRFEPSTVEVNVLDGGRAPGARERVRTPLSGGEGLTGMREGRRVP